MGRSSRAARRGSRAASVVGRRRRCSRPGSEFGTGPGQAGAIRSSGRRVAYGSGQGGAAGRRAPPDVAQGRGTVPVRRATGVRTQDLPAGSFAHGSQAAGSPDSDRRRRRHRENRRGGPDPARTDGPRRGGRLQRPLPAASGRPVDNRTGRSLRDRGRGGNLRQRREARA